MLGESSAGPGRAAAVHEPTPAASRINRLAAALHARSYLELGVEHGYTFRDVAVADRTGVDPAFVFDVAAEANDTTHFHPVASDDFFHALAPATVFDIVYIDGLHTFPQAYRDLGNALLHTHARSVVILDDTTPTDVFSAMPDNDRAIKERYRMGLTGTHWHGDVFKVVFAIHDFHPGLSYATTTNTSHPGTLVWRRPPPPEAPRFRSMEAIERLDFVGFQDNADLLHPMDEDAAVAACVAALASGA